ISYLDLKYTGIVVPGALIGALHQVDALGEGSLGGGSKNRIEIAPGAFLQGGFLYLGGARRDAGSDSRGLQNRFGAQIVAVGVAGSLAGEDAHPNAKRDTLRSALDDRFIHANGTGGKILKIKVGVIPAARKRLIQVAAQIALGDVEAAAKKRLR